MEKWDDIHLDFLLTLRAKGMPFESIAATMRKYTKRNTIGEELKYVWWELLIGAMDYEGKPNNSMDSYDWSAKEIARLKIMRKNGVSLKRARQVLCRSASQIKKQWKLINRPIL